MNNQEVAARVEAASGVEIVSLQHIKAYVWFPNQDGPTTFVVEGPNPLNMALSVFAIFESDDGVRVYCLPTTPEAAKTELSSCYTLDKRSPIFSRAVMSEQTFINEVANEWAIVGTESTTAANEREAVVTFLRDAPPGMLANAAADVIEAGDHLEDDDDDENGVTAPPPPTASSTVPVAKPS
jgi:hypothetical protein